MKKMSHQRIMRIKTLLKTNTVSDVAKALKVSKTTIWYVQRGKYDGKIEDTNGMFNVDQHWDWIVGGMVA